MADRDGEKQAAARAAVRHVRDGMRVGLGSGSTAAWVIRLLGERIRDEHLRIEGVATSSASRELALASGVPLLADEAGFELDLAIDGADEATRAGELIKGAGGALLRERIVAAAAREVVIAVDSRKLVERLGAAPVPVEVHAFGWRNAARRLQELGCAPVLRQIAAAPFRTDEGNLILDCRFTNMPRVDALARTIRDIAGVVDHGFFLGSIDRLVIARGAAIEEIEVARARD